jgi:amino acid transporter
MGGVARTIWAMARDDAFPAPFRKLHPTLNVPIWCIIASFIPQLLIGIIYIFNLTAFYGLISGVLALYTLSYMVPIALHLLYARKHLDITYGPWNLGRFGWAINTVAVIWSIFIFIFLCFPLYQPLVADNM